MTEKLEQIKKLLEEIADGSGAYNRDPLQHAENCIEHMKDLARKGIQLIEEV